MTALLAARAQTPQPALEVASIKPATPLGPMGMRSERTGGPGTNDPGTYTCRNCPVYWVLSEAYDLMTFEYAGPDWVHDARFDFIAKVPAGTTKETSRIMLQNLLAERFKLAAHRGKKEMQVYELTVARNGPKFPEALPAPRADGDGPPVDVGRDKDGFPVLTAGMSMAIVSGHARIRSDNRPISWLVRMLAQQLNGPVIDATSLKDQYSFLLSWAFAEGRSPAAGSGVADAPGAPEPYEPALIEAVQSQLGLKLERKKGQADVLFVDHIEKAPTAN